ncbi:hypothetical protein SCP_0402290 [Sparassis crispa]|uniref:Uncharacterized protein n=1 Tax=Sparassis crispa TaxID=139825 RepID=A0A401GIC8_9APHY|nr:hypothetical protein SCP_0402290 [Sparassis crispa]GBE81855.1 hypothetical protein SCP_0402290 [Sparassis crispa]
MSLPILSRSQLWWWVLTALECICAAFTRGYGRKIRPYSISTSGQTVPLSSLPIRHRWFLGDAHSIMCLTTIDELAGPVGLVYFPAMTERTVALPWRYAQSGMPARRNHVLAS